MGSFNLRDEFEAQVDTRLAALKDELESEDKQNLITNALYIYSKNKPDRKSNDITGAATFDYTINSTNFPDYVIGFSIIEEVEYPFDSTDANLDFLESDAWIGELVSGTSRVLRFKYSKPSASETIRVYYTIPYEFDDSDDVTLPDADVHAIYDLATALILEATANKLISQGEPTIAAESVNHRTKSSEARANAKLYREAYNDHMGIKAAGKERAASHTEEHDTEYSFRADHLTHPRRNF